MSVDFEHPILLLLLPLTLAAVYVLWRTSRAYMPPVRRRASLILRSTVTALLCLVLVSPLVQLRAEELAVAILLDHSDSISPAARAEQEHWLARALASKGTGDQVAVISFAEDASVERTLSDDSRPPRLTPPESGTRTNIASAIRAPAPSAPAWPPFPRAPPAAWSSCRTARRTSTPPSPPPHWRPPRASRS
jgi:hypothetical protein